MTVFGVGTLELILILLVMILIFGPERITEMGTWLGRSYKKIAGISTELNQQVSQIRKSVDTNLGIPKIENPLQAAADEVKGIQKEINKEMQAIPSIEQKEPAAAPDEGAPALDEKEQVE